jgi:hypothetical protein
VAEPSLRWKGRIGSLKPLAVLVIIAAALGLVASVESLTTARANPTGPQPVSIREIAERLVDSRQYVVVAGFAEYEWAYSYEENGRTTVVYYYLYDEDEGYILVVEADATNLESRVDADVALSGITWTMPGDLRALVEEDAEELADYGWVLASTLVLKEGEAPGSETAALAWTIGLGVASLLSVCVLFFPAVVFTPGAAHAGGTGPQVEKTIGVQASGRLQRLKSLQPAIEVGRGWRKFTKAVANVVPLQNRRVMLYIHHIYRYSGIKVSDTQWALVFDPMNVVSVEPGKVVGFKDRWAVRFVHRQRREKPEELIVSFASPEDQGDFVALLRAAGFVLGTGLNHIV